MQDTSAAFKTAIDAKVRRPIAQLNIAFGERFNDSSLIITSGTDYKTTNDQAFNNVFDPTRQWIIIGESAIEDGHSLWDRYSDVADTQELELGWASNFISEIDGKINDVTGDWIQHDFSSRSVGVINVFGDSKWLDYPTEFKIELYDFFTGWFTEYDTSLDVPNTLVKFIHTVDPIETDIIKAKLTIYEWSVAGRHPRILEFSSGFNKEFKRDSISTIQCFKERNNINRNVLGALTANQLIFTIADDGTITDDDLAVNVKINSYLGVVTTGDIDEDVPLGVFYAKDWQRFNGRITCIANDLISILTEGRYTTSEPDTNVSATALLVLILTDAGISSSFYNIDSGYDSYNINYLYLLDLTYHNAIEKVVQAVGGIAYVDEFGVIQFRADIIVPLDTVKTLSNSVNIMLRTVATGQIRAFASAADISYYEFQTAAAAIDVIESTEVLAVGAGDNLTVTLFFPTQFETVTEISTPSFTQSGADITISTFTAFTWGVSITFANAGGGSQNVESITVNGKPVTTVKSILRFRPPTEIEKYGEIVAVVDDNKLIQTHAQATSLAQLITSYFVSPSTIINLPSICDPSLQLGDGIVLPNDISVEDTFIEAENIFYDGSLRSDVMLRRIISVG